MNTIKILHHKKGFSLVEMLIAIAIFGIVIGTILLLSQTSERSYEAGEEKIEMQQNARAAMDLLVREVREIGSDPENIITTPFITANDSKLEFLTDRMSDSLSNNEVTYYNVGDGDVNDIGEHVLYFVRNDTLYRKDFAVYPEGHSNAGQEMFPDTTALVSNVGNLHFTYYKLETDVNGTRLVECATPLSEEDKTNVVNVGIDITIKGSDEVEQRTFALESNASLRGYESWETEKAASILPVEANMSPGLDMNLVDSTGLNVTDTLLCGSGYTLSTNAFDEDEDLEKVIVSWISSAGDSVYIATFYPEDFDHQISDSDTVDLGGEFGTTESYLFYLDGETLGFDPIQDLPDSLIQCCGYYEGSLVAVAYDSAGSNTRKETTANIDCESNYLHSSSTPPPEDDDNWDNMPNTVWYDSFANDDDWGNQDGVYSITCDCNKPPTTDCVTDTTPPAHPDSCDCGSPPGETGNTYRNMSAGGGSHGHITTHTSSAGQFGPGGIEEFTVYGKFRLKDNSKGITSSHSNIAFWCGQNGDPTSCCLLEYQGNSGLYLDGCCNQTTKAPNTGGYFAGNSGNWGYMALAVYDLDPSINGVEVYGHIWAEGETLPSDPRTWALNPTSVGNKYDCFVNSVTKYGGIGISGKKGFCSDEMVVFQDSTLISGGGSGCAEDGDPCTADGDCCSGNCDVCGQAGDPCTTDADCCNSGPGAGCQNGACKKDGTLSGTCVGSGTTPPNVTITAPDANADENGSELGQFKFNLSKTYASALTINYTISGTADNSDYTQDISSGTITIPSGNLFTIMDITPIDDGIQEGDETLTLTLASGSNYNVDSPNAATVTIADAGLPTVSIVAEDAVAEESGNDPGTFRITRSGPTTSAMDVYFDFSSGTADASDYTETLSSPITIPSGDSYVDITITPVSDSDGTEGQESVIIDILTSSSYVIDAMNSSATVNITDAGSAPLPTVEVTAIDNEGDEENQDTATFRFTQDGSSSITVYFSYTFSAMVNTSDYTATHDITAGNIEIPASGSVDVVITPVDDNVTEDEQTITLSLISDSHYNLGTSTSAIISILDNDYPVVTVEAIDNSTGESGGTGTFRISHTGSSSIEINYTLSGTASSADYTSSPSLTGNIWVAGSVDISVSAIDDGDIEPDETLTLGITNASYYTVGSPSSATITIIDNDCGAKNDPCTSDADCCSGDCNEKSGKCK